MTYTGAFLHDVKTESTEPTFRHDIVPNIKRLFLPEHYMIQLSDVVVYSSMSSCDNNVQTFCTSEQFGFFYYLQTGFGYMMSSGILLILRRL